MKSHSKLLTAVRVNHRILIWNTLNIMAFGLMKVHAPYSDVIGKLLACVSSPQIAVDRPSVVPKTSDFAKKLCCDTRLGHVS